MSKDKDIVRQEEFGRDLGLMHEVVITGRKVGMNRDLWRRLAHDETLFFRVAVFIKGALIIETLSGKKPIKTPVAYYDAIEKGELEASKEEIVAISQAMELSRSETNRLLGIVGYTPLPEEK